MSWYYADAGNSIGPITDEELYQLRVNGIVHENTMVWQNGWPEWVPYGQAPGYVPLASSPAAAPPAAATPPPTAVPLQPEAMPASPPVAIPGSETGEVEVSQELAKAAGVFQGGARWYYWIAGLSLVNSAIALFDGGTYFVVGLAVSIIVDQIGYGLSETMGQAAMYGAFGVNLVISAIVAAFGYFSLKGVRWLMIVGIVLYVGDGLIFLLFQDWLSVAFHAYATFCLVNGTIALGKLNAAGIKL
ncbi:MAG: DUF4339 domain-containing protein [Verrucomicrobiota bacterium]